MQALFGILIFGFKRPWHISFFFLTVWFGIISVFLGVRALNIQVIEYFKPGIFPLLFLFGPLLYFYVISLTKENFRLKPVMLLHLLPLLGIGLHRSFSTVEPFAGPGILTGGLFGTNNRIYYTFLILSMFLYSILCLLIILKHRKNIPLFFSNYTARNSLGWLIFVLSIFLFLFVADFFITFLDRVLGINVGKKSILSFNLTAFVFIMIFFGINQSVFFQKRRFHDYTEENNDVQENTESYSNRQTMSDSEIKGISDKIIHYLKYRKPYLNPEYNLQMMAGDLDISRHKLSQVINTGQQKNFYQLINEYRLEEVKKMLADPAFSHFSVLGVGMECGFNSKTTFNRIFKEATGLTPSEYKKKQVGT